MGAPSVRGTARRCWWGSMGKERSSSMSCRTREGSCWPCATTSPYPVLPRGWWHPGGMVADQGSGHLCLGGSLLPWPACRSLWGDGSLLGHPSWSGCHCCDSTPSPSQAHSNIPSCCGHGTSMLHYTGFISSHSPQLCCAHPTLVVSPGKVFAAGVHPRPSQPPHLNKISFLQCPYSCAMH